MPAPTSYDDPRLVALRELAAEQDGVVSRRQAYALGVTRWEIRSAVRARRWQLLTDQCFCLHNGPVARRGHLWAAVLTGGPRACLDGASALEVAGVQHLDVPRIRVSVPRGARVRRTPLYDIRQTRRWCADDIVAAGIPRTRPPVAAVRAGLWARTDREAAFAITLTVQQRLAPPVAVGEELLRVRRDKRLRLLGAVVNDLIDGARSLGELDLVRELRRRGLPVPDLQVVRQDKAGRYYLDLYWRERRLVVEVDGVHHGWATHMVADALRQNALVLDADRVLRVPLLGLRLAPDAFFAQIAAALGAPGTTAA